MVRLLLCKSHTDHQTQCISPAGVDFSAAEAFVRMQRLLDERGVILVLCGCPVDSPVGIALRSVDLWSDHADDKVVVLQNLNDALEVRRRRPAFGDRVRKCAPAS